MANHFTDSNIDFWIQNNLNVLLRGKHGVGKTARILEAFKRHNLKFQYFSASTMDPWVDFIGVPKERTDPATGNAYLDLVRPKVWQDDEVEAVFLDEFNRASKKVRNAVMELIQFKSINGRRFKNLKIVWAAINPEEEEVNKYDVEALDPAQLDRFHVILNVPYAPDADYFRTKYGRAQADVAISWWKELDNAAKDLVSPRRLDYILEIHAAGGSVHPVVHSSITIQPLIQQLKNGPIAEQLEKIYNDRNISEARKFMSAENTYATAIGHIVKKNALIEFFVPLLGQERITVLMNKHPEVKRHVLGNFATYKEIIQAIAASKTGELSVACQNVIFQNVDVSQLAGDKEWTGTGDEKTLQTKLQTLKSIQQNNTANRVQVYETIKATLPKSLSVSVAVDTLKVLEPTLVSSAEQGIITKMDQLPSMVGHLIKVLKSHGFKWDGIVDSNKVMTKLNAVKVLVTEQQKLKEANSPGF